MRSRRWFRTAAVAAAVLTGALGHVSAEPPPRRVVSMNVCTDQLAMLIAAPGQLHSVSYLAGDAGTSAMTAEAAAYPTNHGLAEEIFLMKPDLVVAGAYSTRATVSMLRRLGFAVEAFQPESSFDDVRANMRRMGEVLGRKDRAEALVRQLDRGLRALLDEPGSGAVVATYSSNSYSAGRGALSAAIIEAVGLENLGSRFGLVGVGYLPLEMLVLSDVDIVTAGTRSYGSPALAQQNFVHPAYRALVATRQEAVVPEPTWICGGPFNLAAAAILREAAAAARQGPGVR